jgi:hypothetical protein
MPARQLPKPIVLFVRLAFAAVFAALALTTPLGGAASAADGCVNQPEAPQGSHWYYRVDRSSNRVLVPRGPRPSGSPRYVGQTSPDYKADVAYDGGDTPRTADWKDLSVTPGANIPGGEAFSTLWHRQQAPVGSIGLGSSMRTLTPKGNQRRTHRKICR